MDYPKWTPCPIPLSLPVQRDRTVQIATRHLEKIPPNFLSKIHTSLRETDFMKADLYGMKFYLDTRYNKLR